MSVSLSQNYFEVFALPLDFHLNTQQLTERYRELQKTVHPDRFANASDRDRRLAVQQAANVNEAYSVLKSPLKRARYLLILAGIDFDDEKETTQDPEFLMEQIELRESLAAVRALDDPFAEIEKLMKTIEQKKSTMLDTIAKQINAQEYSDAKTQVQKLQFFEKLLIECENLEQDLTDSL